MGDGDSLADLRDVWLLSGCSRAELRRIDRLCETVDVDAGTLLTLRRSKVYQEG